MQRWRLCIDLRVTGRNRVEKETLISRPPLIGEDLDFAMAGEAGGVHPVADFADVDAAFAHESDFFPNC